MIVLAVVVMVQPRAICHTPRMLHQIVGHLLKFRHGRSSLVEDDDLQRRCRVLASGASQRQGVNSRAQRKRTCPLKQLLSLRMPRKTMRAGQQPPVHAHWQVGASAQARDVAPRCRGRTRGKAYHLPACSLSQASRVLDNDIARGFFDGAATRDTSPRGWRGRRRRRRRGHRLHVSGHAYHQQPLPQRTAQARALLPSGHGCAACPACGE